jgi:methionine biosynthesis protein MetW
MTTTLGDARAIACTDAFATVRPARRRPLHQSIALAVRRLVHEASATWSYLRRRPRFPAGALSYDQYWCARDPVTVGRRFELLAALVGERSSVLDVGCGEGMFLEYVAHTRRARGVGVDISSAAVERVRLRGIEAEVADVGRGELPAGRFDHVVCAEMLEHIAEPELVLRAAAARAVKSVLVTLPNTGWYADRLRLLFGRFPVQWLHHPAEHLRFFTLADFRDFARDLGFRIRSLHAATGLPVLMDWFPGWFAQQVVYELEVTTTPPSASDGAQ